MCRLNERKKCEGGGAHFRRGPKVEVKLSKVISKTKKEKISFYFKHDLSS